MSIAATAATAAGRLGQPSGGAAAGPRYEINGVSTEALRCQGARKPGQARRRGPPKSIGNSASAVQGYSYAGPTRDWICFLEGSQTRGTSFSAHIGIAPALKASIVYLSVAESKIDSIIDCFSSSVDYFQSSHHDDMHRITDLRRNLSCLI